MDRLDRGRRLVIILTILALGGIAAFLHFARGRIESAVSGIFGKGRRVEDRLKVDSGLAETVTMTKGPIPVEAFLEYLQDCRGIPVIGDPSIAGREILIASDIKDANARVVLEILKKNGSSFSIESYPGNREVIWVKADATSR